MPEGSLKSPRSPLYRIRIESFHLITAIALLAGAQNLLLLRFLGVTISWLYLAGAILLGLAAIFLVRQRSAADAPKPTLLRFLTCLAISVGLFLLAGEGRLFYANIDWQVRDAVMGDMIRNPWPFVYEAGGAAYVLRAPIGMFLFPALAGKMGGMAAADLVLLLQNSLFLAALMTLASTLFERTRSRLIALLVFLLFSGMDVLGQLLGNPGHALDPVSHLEQWAGIQYSSTVTLAFWVPQHALVGWCAGLLFLLWQRGLISLGAFLSPLPLLAIWSPLALMGAAPFAFYAGAKTLLTRRIGSSDVVLAMLASLLAIPALLYLQAGSGSVGMRFLPIAPALYILFQLLEIAPYLAAAWLPFFLRQGGAMDGLLISTACLLLFPFVQIGVGADFVMRASIPPLLILAATIADVLQRPGGGSSRHRHPMKLLLVITLAIGSVTPGHEIARALSMRPTPYPECNLIGAWTHSEFPGAKLSTPDDMATYLAPPDSLPIWAQADQPWTDRGRTSGPCWERRWIEPR